MNKSKIKIVKISEQKSDYEFWKYFSWSGQERGAYKTVKNLTTTSRRTRKLSAELKRPNEATKVLQPPTSNSPTHPQTENI